MKLAIANQMNLLSNNGEFYSFSCEHNDNLTREDIELNAQNITLYKEDWDIFEKSVLESRHMSFRNVAAQGDCNFICASLHIFGCRCHARFLRGISIYIY